MRKFAKSTFMYALALLFSISTAFAQDRSAFGQEELDQMLAPIALYPDSLLSQILMASTYPLEVVQAARWSRANPGFKGQDAVNAVAQMDWDPSVQSLVAFPQVLAMMDEKIDWTQRLGEAFLAQQPEVMDTVQGLRQRAAAAGYLNSSEQVSISEQGGTYIIEPAHPQIVYVPYYDPTVVYGPWWWPAYPPVYWGPPAGYYVGPAYYPGFFWGSGIRISVGFFFGAFDWHRRDVHVVHVHHSGRRAVASAGPVRWRHDDRHRRGVPYRYAAPQRVLTGASASGSDTRRSFRQQGAAPAPRISDGARTSDTRTRTQWRRDNSERRTGQNTAPASTQINSGTSTANTGTEPRTGQSGRQAPRIQERPRELRPDAGQRSSRSPEARPPVRTQAPRIQERPRELRPDAGQRSSRSPEARPPVRTQAPSARSRGRPEPQARSARDQGIRSSRGGTPNVNSAPPPRPAVSSPAPRTERAGQSGNRGARSGNRGPQNRQEEPRRGRDRRS